MSNSEIFRAPSIGALITVPSHFIDHVHEFDALYMWELAKELGTGDPDEIRRQIESGSIPSEAAERGRESLEAKRTMRLVYRGTRELTTVPSKKTRKYGRKEFERKCRKRFDEDVIVDDGFYDPVELEEIDSDVVYIGTGASNAEALRNLERSGNYGSIDTRFTYFSPDYRLALSHADDEDPMLLEIDLTELAQRRYIFRDPESSYLECEKGRTFVVMGGIPSEAIHQMHIFERAKAGQA